MTSLSSKCRRGRHWRIKNARWLDEVEADAVGLTITFWDGYAGWPTSGGGGVEMRQIGPAAAPRLSANSPKPLASYNYDYPMSSSLNEFAITVDDGNPSDVASGARHGASSAIHRFTPARGLIGSGQSRGHYTPLDPSLTPGEVLSILSPGRFWKTQHLGTRRAEWRTLWRNVGHDGRT